MGGFDTVEQWRRCRLREIIDRLDSPHADKVFVAKGYTKADLCRDLMEIAAEDNEKVGQLNTTLETFSLCGPVTDWVKKSTV